MSARAAFAVVLCAAGVSAAATPVPVVVVPVRPATTPEAAAVVWSARRAVEGHAALSAVDVTEVLSTGGGAETDVDAGRAALKAARGAFEALEVDRAAHEGERAVRLLLRSGADEASAVDALLLLARVRQAVRDEEGTVGALQRALRLDPELKLDPESASPSLVRALERARRPAAGAPGRLRVDSADIPAAVSIDGHFLGVTPAFIDPLAPGAHLLVVEADGRRREVRLLDVPSGAGQAVRVDLEPAPRASLFERVTDRLRDQLDADTAMPALGDLKSLFFAEQAILVDVRDGEARAALFDLRAGQRVRAVEVSAASPARCGEEIVRRLYGDLDARAPALADVPVPPPATEGEGAGLTDQWWFWPAAGVAAAAAVAIPVLLLTGGADEGLPHRDDAGAVVIRF